MTSQMTQVAWSLIGVNGLIYPQNKKYRVTSSTTAVKYRSIAFI